MIRVVTYFVFALLTSVTAMAVGGNNQPMFQVGKVWNYRLDYVDNNFNFRSCFCKHWVDGDTISQGHLLYKMKFSCPEVYGDTIVSFWYEDDGRVYIYEKGTDYLVYDFNLASDEYIPNEGVLFAGGNDFKVMSVDTISIGGTYHKRLNISYLNRPFTCWVEGVGGPTRIDEPLRHAVSDGKTYTLLSCYLDGECLFTKEDFDAEPYNADIEGIELPHAYATSSPGATYDMHGRKVGAATRPGVHIRNGMKRVVK